MVGAVVEVVLASTALTPLQEEVEAVEEVAELSESLVLVLVAVGVEDEEDVEVAVLVIEVVDEEEGGETVNTSEKTTVPVASVIDMKKECQGTAFASGVQIKALDHICAVYHQFQLLEIRRRGRHTPNQLHIRWIRRRPVLQLNRNSTTRPRPIQPKPLSLHNSRPTIRKCQCARTLHPISQSQNTNEQ